MRLRSVKFNFFNKFLVTDSNVEEEKNTNGDQDVSSSHILIEEKAHKMEEIEAECNGTVEVESHLVPSGEDGESHEVVDNALVPKTESETITEAFNQTEAVLAENTGDIYPDDDKENTPIQTIEAFNDTTTDNGKYNIHNANNIHKM